MSLPNEWDGLPFQSQPEYVPTEEEIKEKTKEIRSKWTPWTREQRRVTKTEKVFVTRCAFLTFLQVKDSFLITEGR